MLIGPVGHIDRVSNCLVAAGPHHGTLRNWRLKVGVAVHEEAHPETILIFPLDIVRRHADGAVVGVIVRVDHVLDDIYPAHGAAVRQICLYTSLDGAVEPLHHSRLLLALICKVNDTVTVHQGLKVCVEKLLVFVGL